MLPVMRPRHVNGTATTMPSTVAVLRGLGQRLILFNSGDNQLQVSFDGGQHYFPIPVGESLDVYALYYSFVVQTSVDTTTYAALLFEG